MNKLYKNLSPKCNPSCETYLQLSNRFGYCKLIHVDYDNPTGGLVIINDDCQLPFYESLYGKLGGDKSDQN